jgi:hypothetical protein
MFDGNVRRLDGEAQRQLIECHRERLVRRQLRRRSKPNIHGARSFANKELVVSGTTLRPGHSAGPALNGTSCGYCRARPSSQMEYESAIDFLLTTIPTAFDTSCQSS